MSNTIDDVSRVNKIFKLQLIDTYFLKLFKQRFYYDFLYQVHFVRKTRNKSQKQAFIQELEIHTNQLLKYLKRPSISFNNIFNSKKITDTVILVRHTLLHNKDAMRKFMEKRKKTFEEIKGNQMEKNQLEVGFNIFYELVLQGNTSPTNKGLKKILVGIRKLLRESKTIKRDLHNRRNKLYLTNRIIKDILQHLYSEKQTIQQDPQFGNSIEKILEQKKWLGPNLYKIIKTHKWKGYEIDLLADKMEQSIQKQSILNIQRKTRSLILRTIKNIRKHSQYIKANQKNESYKLIQSQKNFRLSRSDFFYVQDMQNPLLRYQQPERQVQVPSRPNLHFQFDNQPNQQQ